MEVVIASLTVPSLEDVRRQGASHATLGSLLNGGSHCTVESEAQGKAETFTSVRAAAARSGLSLTEAADPASLPGGQDGLTLLGVEAAVADLVRVGERAAVCLFLSDGAARPMVVLYGRGLPVLGSIPPCTLRDLESTWISLAGGTPPEGGRNLLHEQPEAWDPDIERQLTRRLRQLYGE
jgi:hypothetical protein